MPFTTSVAGPSRLPFQVVARPTRAFVRAYASSPTPDPVQQESVQDGDAEVSFNEPDALPDKDSKAAKAKEREMWGSGEGFRRWLQSEGGKYRDVKKGQRANWLGGNIPYSSNPSFRPPPPLSNDLQNILYAELSRGNKTVGQLAEQFSVSKARIEAVRKLKEVEREFKRQSLPLQQAFLDGMEPLLGVRSPIGPRTKAIDVSLEREETTSRLLHPSTSVELQEEERWDANIGEGGAFSDRVAQEKREGIERTVWEFRAEEMVLAERKAEQAAREAVGGKGETAERVAEADATAETPEQAHTHAHAHAVKERKELPSRTASSGAKAPFKFIDTSSLSSRGKQSSRK